jgi:hypothetical protein
MHPSAMPPDDGLLWIDRPVIRERREPFAAVAPMISGLTHADTRVPNETCAAAAGHRGRGDEMTTTPPRSSGSRTTSAKSSPSWRHELSVTCRGPVTATRIGAGGAPHAYPRPRLPTYAGPAARRLARGGYSNLRGGSVPGVYVRTPQDEPGVPCCGACRRPLPGGPGGAEGLLAPVPAKLHRQRQAEALAERDPAGPGAALGGAPAVARENAMKFVALARIVIVVALSLLAAPLAATRPAAKMPGIALVLPNTPEGDVVGPVPRGVIYLETAKALGLTVPPSVVARADEIMRLDRESNSRWQGRN